MTRFSRWRPWRIASRSSEAGGNADELGIVAVARLEVVERFLECLVNTDHRLRHAAFGNFEDERLGAVECFDDVVGRVVAHLRDVPGDPDEAAQQREVVDDARVVTCVRGRGSGRLDLEQRGASADELEEIGAAELLGDGDRIGRLALPVERLDRVVDVAVRRLVEVGDFDSSLHRGGDRVAGEQHGAEQRLLGLEVVRRHPTGLWPPNGINRLDHCRPGLPRIHAP